MGELRDPTFLRGKGKNVNATEKPIRRITIAPSERECKQ